VDRLEIECQQLSRLETVSERNLAPAGGGGGTRTREKCAGRSALIALTYHVGSRVDRLGGICAEVSTSSGVDTVGSVFHYMQAHGGTGGKVDQDTAPANCGAGGVLVGLQVRAGAQIDAIGGQCAPAGTWSDPNNAFVPVNMPMRGGGGGSLLPPRTCPRGEFLVGWEIGSGTVVDSVQPICRNFN
jgi:hypothetical protein